MSYEIRADYETAWLFPPRLEEWVSDDHPARLIRELVDAMDLPGLGFRTRQTLDGRPNYAADLLLKVWLYGYLNGIRHTRKLERACREHLSLLWLTGLHAPDHNTLWRFWCEQRDGLRQVFKRVVQFALKANLVEVALHAVDGTKIAARASKEAVCNRERLERVLAQLDVAVEEVMQEVEAAEAAASGEYRLPPDWQDQARRREQVRELLGELDASGRSQIHPSEREARLMKTRAQGIVPAYNAQVVVDGGGEGLIVAEDVTTDESDNRQLVKMVEAAKAVVGGAADETVADGAYYLPAQLAKAAQQGYPVLVNEGEQRSPTEGSVGSEFHASRFRYDSERDCCVCPRGVELRFEKQRPAREHRDAFRVYRCHSYRDCPVRWQCSQDKRGRSIELGIHHAVVLAQRRKQQRPDKRALLARRKQIAETPFATIKEAMGFRRWTVAGLDQVRTQWAMVCTAFNLLKLYPRWAAGQLVFA